MINIARLSILILLSIVLGHSVFGQHKTFLGIEGAIAKDLIKVEDKGNSLETVALHNHLWGITVRQELKSRLFLETGVFFKTYWLTAAFDPDFYVYHASCKAVLIPLRLGYSIKLSKKLSLLLMPGVTLGINRDDYWDSGTSWLTEGNSRTDFTYTENEDVSKYFMLLNPTIGIEQKFFKSTVPVSIYLTRNFGFTRIHQLDITYSVDGSAPVEAKVMGYGEFWSLSLSVKYPISNIWQK